MAKSVWGRYDIRAVVDEHFNAETFHRIGVTYGQFLQKHAAHNSKPIIAIGHDARIHSIEFCTALIQGLLEQGVDVIKLGFTTSPIVYFADHLHTLNADFPELNGTVMITASHNPAEYNGVKFTYQKRSMSDAEFQELKTSYAHLPEDLNTIQAKEAGTLIERSIIPDYLAWMEAHFGKIGNGIKVVVDSGNATAGVAAPELMRRLGCDVVELFSEPDGTFPNHHPDPCVLKNLEILQDVVLKEQADIGFSFDGDSDRVGLVDDKGRALTGDVMMLVLAEALLRDKPGSTVLFDIKSTQTLFNFMSERQGIPVLAPSGHAFIKRIMKECDIPLGGELSGHVFFRDRHWGFDDAIYGACRILEVLHHHKQLNAQYKFSEFSDSLPYTKASEEFRIHCTRDEGTALIENLQAVVSEQPDFFGPAVVEVLTLDGLRVNFEEGFFLIRLSNTEPCMTLRFEAGSDADYRRIEQQLQSVIPALKALLTPA